VTGETVTHPAVFSPIILDVAAELLSKHVPPGALLLDPFAGTGRVHQLDHYRTIGVEIEPEWAELHPATMVGDATELPLADAEVDAVVTSPTYGNRMADHHEARDGSYRRTYRHALGRPLTRGNSGSLQWGDRYRDLHEQAWSEVRRVLRAGGFLLLNVKDHQRCGRRAEVCAWHLAVLDRLGFTLTATVEVDTNGFRYGANRAVRYPEMLFLLTASPTPASRASRW
jgi:tRNA G10  N-methylase Trm11